MQRLPSRHSHHNSKQIGVVDVSLSLSSSCIFKCCKLPCRGTSLDIRVQFSARRPTTLQAKKDYRKQQMGKVPGQVPATGPAFVPRRAAEVATAAVDRRRRQEAEQLRQQETAEQEEMAMWCAYNSQGRVEARLAFNLDA